jgi:hypothetical protein
VNDNELYFLLFLLFCITTVVVTIVVFDYLDTCARSRFLINLKLEQRISELKVALEAASKAVSDWSILNNPNRSHFADLEAIDKALEGK